LKTVSADLLTDGFKLLDRLPIDEIKLRIAWLEDSLASYRTILVVKEIMARKPAMLQTPPEWEPIVETAPPAYVVPKERPAKPVKEGQTADVVRQYMLEHLGVAVPIADIARETGVSMPSVHNALKGGLGTLYRKCDRGVYTYIGPVPVESAPPAVNAVDRSSLEEEERREREKYVI
jgi:hypothetical protein